MAILVPFRALRPTPASAVRVAAVPYDVVGAEEARALANGNPLSFLHVSRPEIDLPAGTSPYADAVYAKAAENFTRLKADAPLVLDETPRLYVYRLRMGAHEQTGVAGCFSVDEYDSDVIKKHERTRRDKEDDRTRHMIALRAQTGPVFLVYQASPAVDAVADRATRTQPLFEITAPDGVQHTIWPVEARDERELIDAFGAVPALYIADGHHRAASAARARQCLRGQAGATGEWDTFLAVAFPGSQMRVLPYNRVVKDLGALTPESLLARLREPFTVTEGPATPTRRGEVAMFLGSRWYTIDLGGAPKEAAAAARLDVSRLQDMVLTPLLGIGDIRTDKRIDFVGGARGTRELETLVNSGRFAVAFSLYPVSVDDLMTISDAGGIMPPKSTWFEPKLRDGLLSHVI
ncbi:MAG TPA: DUF1015 family protein [Vicinamibacterales bacterium]